MARKLRIGWFTFTCSGDSSIILLELLNKNFFEWKKKIDFKYFKYLKSKNKLNNLDVAFVEGAISNNFEEKKLKEIRKNCKKLVAVGSCAITGYPAAQRNKFDLALKKEIKPILKEHGLWPQVKRLDEIVKIDDKVPGCPMDPKIFIETLNEYLKFKELI
jgi:coenzyme F420-reducing hydrogenase gamma subunit